MREYHWFQTVCNHFYLRDNRNLRATKMSVFFTNKETAIPVMKVITPPDQHILKLGIV